MDCADLRSHALDDAGVEVGPGSDCARWLERMSPEARIEWALAQLPGAHVLSSSFGAQSAVLSAEAMNSVLFGRSATMDASELGDRKAHV